jgi:SAM-dependent methyltransferase
MKDSWESGNPYERFMGRWSRLVSDKFIDWLAAPTDLKWLDVGCGTGALSEAIQARQQPRTLYAIDQSQGFVESTQARLGIDATCQVGNAMDLPLPDSSFDLTVSGLVLNFIPDPVKALGEMRRVTIPGGLIAIYVWDYAEGMQFLKYFWDAVVELDPNAANLHEATRFPDTNRGGLAQLLNASELRDHVIEPLEIKTRFPDFDDYWEPFLGGQGPAPTYLVSLDESDREEVRNLLVGRLPIQSDGSIELMARAWGAKCEA